MEYSMVLFSSFLSFLIFCLLVLYITDKKSIAIIGDFLFLFFIFSSFRFCFMFWSSLLMFIYIEGCYGLLVDLRFCHEMPPKYISGFSLLWSPLQYNHSSFLLVSVCLVNIFFLPLNFSLTISLHLRWVSYS